MDRSVLENKALAELREIASALDLSGVARMKKADLVDLIMGVAADNGNGDGSRSVRPATNADADAEPDGADTAASGDDSAEHGADDRTDEDGDGDGRDRNRQRRRRNRPGQGGEDLEDAEVREGVLDLLPEGYGFLRTTGYLSGQKDVYVSQSYVRRFNLRRGDLVAGPIRSNNRGSDKFPALARVDTIEGLTVDDHVDLDRPDFRDLTPVSPSERLHLDSGDGASVDTRIVDLLAPVGKGQRGVVGGAVRSGRSTLLQAIARAVEGGHPDAHLMVLLVDGRPEEVTWFERSVSGEVVASTFDHPAEDHTQVAELVVERAKRLVERGRDVVVLVDGLTRLARAYAVTASSGRSLPEGVDAAAVHAVKRLLAAARAIEEGGSLTIVSTATTGSESEVDNVLYAELRETMNMELRLDGDLAVHRVFPAVDVHASGTLREGLLRDHEDGAIDAVREDLAGLDARGATERLVEQLRDSKDTSDFLATYSAASSG